MSICILLVGCGVIDESAYQAVAENTTKGKVIKTIVKNDMRYVFLACSDKGELHIVEILEKGSYRLKATVAEDTIIKNASCSN